jgi:hypothetical protein
LKSLLTASASSSCIPTTVRLEWLITDIDNS